MYKVGMSKRYVSSRTSVHHIGYHIIWCTKYRRKVLIGDIPDRLKQLLQERAAEIDVSIEALEVMPDHVHLFVRSCPTNAPHYIVGRLKGYTSRILRSEFCMLRSRIPTLWTRSYFVHSVGCISEDVIRRYVEEQKNK